MSISRCCARCSTTSRTRAVEGAAGIGSAARIFRPPADEFSGRWTSMAAAGPVAQLASCAAGCAQQVEQKFAQAGPPAAEAAGFTNWSFGALPELLEVKTGAALPSASRSVWTRRCRAVAGLRHAGEGAERAPRRPAAVVRAGAEGAAALRGEEPAGLRELAIASCPSAPRPNSRRSWCGNAGAHLHGRTMADRGSRVPSGARKTRAPASRWWRRRLRG